MRWFHTRFSPDWSACTFAMEFVDVLQVMLRVVVFSIAAFAWVVYVKLRRFVRGCRGDARKSSVRPVNKFVNDAGSSLWFSSPYDATWPIRGVPHHHLSTPLILLSDCLAHADNAPATTTGPACGTFPQQTMVPTTTSSSSSLPQVPLGRKFRSLKIWLTMRAFGLDKVKGLIRHHTQLAKDFENLVRKDDR